ALVPLAVGVWLVAAGVARLDRAGLVTLVRVGGLPFLAAGGYVAWLLFDNGVPASQSLFVHDARAAGLAGGLGLVWRLALVAVVYTGLFALPVAAALAVRAGRLLSSPAAWIWSAAVIAGVAVLAIGGRWMPDA